MKAHRARTSRGTVRNTRRWDDDFDEQIAALDELLTMVANEWYEQNGSDDFIEDEESMTKELLKLKGIRI